MERHDAGKVFKGVVRGGKPLEQFPGEQAKTGHWIWLTGSSSPGTDQLWVAGSFYVFVGELFAAFVIDVFFPRIVGWGSAVQCERTGSRYAFER